MSKEFSRRNVLVGLALLPFSDKSESAPVPIGKERGIIESQIKKEWWQKEVDAYVTETLSAYFQLPHNTDVEALTPYGKKVLAEAVKHFLYDGFSKGYSLPKEIFENRTNIQPLRDALTRILEQTKDASLRRVSSGALGEIVINKIALGAVIFLFKDAPSE